MGSTLGGQWTGLVSASILVSEGPGESRMELQEPTKLQLAPSLGLSRVSGSAPPAPEYPFPPSTSQ